MISLCKIFCTFLICNDMITLLFKGNIIYLGNVLFKSSTISFCHFGCKCKSILIIPQNFYGISFSVAEDENTVSIIRIQLEAETDSSSQSRDLFSKICGSTGKEDPGGSFCNTLHHNFFSV